MTKLVNEPALRDDLHPSADTGRAGTDPHEAKIAILKCLEDPADDDCRSHEDSRNVTRDHAFAKLWDDDLRALDVSVNFLNQLALDCTSLNRRSR
jgi:hypothetical protein